MNNKSKLMNRSTETDVKSKIDGYHRTSEVRFDDWPTHEFLLATQGRDCVSIRGSKLFSLYNEAMFCDSSSSVSYRSS